MQIKVKSFPLTKMFILAGTISLFFASWSSYWLYRQTGYVALSYCKDYIDPYAIAHEAIRCSNYNNASFMLKITLLVCVLSFLISYVLKRKNAKDT